MIIRVGWTIDAWHFLLLMCILYKNKDNLRNYWQRILWNLMDLSFLHMYLLKNPQEITKNIKVASYKFYKHGNNKLVGMKKMVIKTRFSNNNKSIFYYTTIFTIMTQLWYVIYHLTFLTIYQPIFEHLLKEKASSTS